MIKPLGLAVSLAAIGLLGCSAEVEPEQADPIGRTTEPVDLISGGGFLPVPAQQVNGKWVQHWDGTLVDLMAADAWAFCAPWWRTESEEGPTDSYFDRYLEHLRSLTSPFSCGSTPSLLNPTWQPGEVPSEALKWAARRTDPTCNMDPVNGNPVAVTPPWLEDNNDENDNPVNRWAAYDVLGKLHPASGTPPGGYTGAPWQATREAAQELGFAGMNLCMASQLREHMLSADVLIASGSAQRQLLEVIRERAHLALMEFTLLGHAFTSQDAGSLTPVMPDQFIPPLRKFAETLAPIPELPLKELGRDYARALRLYIDATEELAELFARSASAGSDLAELGGGTSIFSDDAEWAEARWRGRLLNLLYGGDPLGTPRQDQTIPIAVFPQGQPAASFNAEWGDFAGIADTFTPSTWADSAALPHVSTRVTSPEVFSLLGLARRADTLYLAHDDNAGVWSALPGTSADFLYRAVEANLRNLACKQQTPDQPCNLTADHSDLTGVTTDYSLAKLWLDFRITPVHATELAAWLHEVFRSARESGDRSPVWLSGAFDFEDKPPQLLSDTVDAWLHVDPDFRASDTPTTVLASRYQVNAGFHMPGSDLIDPLNARLQGFSLRRPAIPSILGAYAAAGGSNLAARYMGAVPVLSAVRDGLLRIKVKAATDQVADDFVSFSSQMMETIQAAIGPMSFSVRPKTRSTQLLVSGGRPFGCSENVGPSVPCFGIVQEVDGAVVKVQVDVVRPEGSPDAEIVLVDKRILELEPPEGANRPGLELRHVANVAAAEYTPPRAPLGSAITRAQLDTIPGKPLQDPITDTTLHLTRESATVEWKYGQGPSLKMTDDAPVILLRTTEGPVEYTVLADGTGLVEWERTSGGEVDLLTSTAVVYSHDGKYGSIGGSLNAKATEQWASQAPNFAEPAFDAFGIPKNWIPPTNPELFGGNEGEDSVAFYLRSARTAADEATTAVRFALESVIAEKADSQKLQAARERSQGIRKLEATKLCGSASSNTDDGCVAKVGIYLPKVNVACKGEVCDALRADIGKLVRRPGELGYFLLEPVALALNNNNREPSFFQYRGGELHTLALNQWRAVRALETAVAEADKQLHALHEALNAADLRVKAAEKQFGEESAAQQALLTQVFQRWISSCGKCGMEAPAKPEFSEEDLCCIDYWPEGALLTPEERCRTAQELAAEAAIGWGPLPPQGCRLEENGFNEPDTKRCEIVLRPETGFNKGPIIAQQKACADADIAFRNHPFLLSVDHTDVAAAVGDATAKEAEAWAAHASIVDRIATLVGDILVADAAVAQAVEKLKLAQERVDLDASVEQSGVASQLSLSRRYHHYDFWRARALLEDARRLSSAARRAIEGRFALNLSEMDGNEPFVAAPALWADEVYEYDLDAPAAVGLSITPAASGSDNLYPNKLSDYVRNLENFVRGYSVKRPTASALGDAEVVTIAGPEVKQTLSSGEDETTIVAGQSTGWTFQCTEGGPWATNPAAATPGKAALNWSFLKNDSAPFANEGFGPAASLSVFSGSVGAPAAALGGRAVYFDGSSELWTGEPTTAGETSGGITVLVWANLRAYHANGSNFILKHRPTGDWLAVQLAEVGGSGAWHSVVNIDGSHVIVAGPATEPLPLHQWFQLGMTFDGRILRLYKDGALVKEQQLVLPEAAPESIDWGEHGGWYVGKQINAWIGPTIVDNAVYTPERIKADYEKTIAYTKPTLAWQFKEPENTACSEDKAFGCGIFSCGCVADHCTGGNCAELFDFNVGSAGSLGLILGAGSGAATKLPEFPTPSGFPTVYLDGAKSLTTPATRIGESPAEITLSAWVYVLNPPSGNFIHFIARNYNFDTWAAPFHSLTLGESTNGKFRARVAVAGSVHQAIATTGVPRDKWSHVAMTFDASTIRLYLDGTQLAEQTVPGAPAPIDWGNTGVFDDHGPWFVGGVSVGAGSEFLHGGIGDVRIEPRARSLAEIIDLYQRGFSGTCFLDDACVGTLSCCPERVEQSPLRTMCDGKPPERAKISFQLDPWGRQNDYYANAPYTERHNVRWGRMAVNLVGVGVRDCSRAPDPTACYAESFLRYNLSHSGPTWVSDYNGSWVSYGLPIGQVEGGKALAIEEWVDPIVNGWNQPYVSAVQRHELLERPVGGSYEFELEVTPDVQLDRIERVQLLMETNYWVRQK